jgi:hypothetical protein
MMHIPYKSAGAGLTALLANETQVSFLSPVTAAVSGPCVLSIIPGGNHVVNNLWYRYRDQTADWMSRQLYAV